MPLGLNVTTAQDGTIEVRCGAGHPTLRFPGKVCNAPLVKAQGDRITFVCCKGGHFHTVSRAEFLRLLDTPVKS